MKTLFTNNAVRVMAILIVISLYALAKMPELSSTEKQQLAANFSFTQVAMPLVPGPEFKMIRAVNPSLEHISGWISSVGAAVALNDLDGDGLANDLCYVETRTNQLIVAPAPDTGARYQAFTLSVQPYDENTMAPMGCLPLDWNEDGYMDVLVYYWGRTPIIFEHTTTSLSYTPKELVTSQERWFTNAAVATDLDGDGHVDVIIANYFQDGATILDASSNIPDFMQHSMSRAYNGGGTYFFLKKGEAWQRINGEEVLDKNSNYSWTLALGAADLDGDLLPEVYFANDFAPDRLLHNRSTPGKLSFTLLEGKRGLTTPASKVVGKDSFKGMGVDFTDLNGDGWLDFFVSNIAAEYALEESHFLFMSTGQVEQMKMGVAPYLEVSEPYGVARSNWSWGNKFADFNNDGKPELIQTTGFLKGEVDRWPELQQTAIGNDELLKYPSSWPRFKPADETHPSDDLSGYVDNPFYTQHNGKYVNINTELKLDQLQVSRGIAIADVDGDGDLDFALANQWEDSHFYRNDIDGTSNFLGLHVRVPPNAEKQIVTYTGHPNKPSSPAIIAEAKVMLPNNQRLVAQVDNGNGHSGKRSHDLHFGGINSKVKVELKWRDREGQVQNTTLALTPGWHTVELY